MVRPVPKIIEHNTFALYAQPIAAIREKRGSAHAAAPVNTIRTDQITRMNDACSVKSGQRRIPPGRRITRRDRETRHQKVTRTPTCTERGGSIDVGVRKFGPVTTYSSTSFDRVARL